MQGHCEGEMLFMYDRRSVAFRAVVRATAMGIYQASYGLGMFGGPYIMGLAGDSVSLSASYWVAIGLSIAGAAYAVYVIKGKRHVIVEEG